MVIKRDLQIQEITGEWCSTDRGYRYWVLSIVESRFQLRSIMIGVNLSRYLHNYMNSGAQKCHR